MSYFFDVDDETVWSPSLDVGRLYVDLAEALARYIAVPSGLVADAEDMYDIHPGAFPNFIYQLAESEAHRHPVYHSLVRGFVGTSLVILERGSIGEDVVATISGRFSAEVAAMRKAMPS